MSKDFNDNSSPLYLKNNREEYFTFIYNQYAQKIFNLSYKMTGSKEDAEDITQKTFIQAFLSIDHFRGESQLSTWLYSIAKNLCFQYLSQRKRGSFSVFEKLILKVQSEDSIQPFQEIEKEYYVNQIREGCLLGLLRCLSLQQRIAFILYILLKVDLKSVAITLRKSESATRTLIHRAKKNLKRFLCVHCSCYDSNNSCTCESFINFSLEHEWIESGRMDCESNSLIFNTDTIVYEIDEMKRFASLYASLPDRNPSDSFAKMIKESIKGKHYLLFSDKKVK